MAKFLIMAFLHFFNFKNSNWFDVTDCNFFVLKSCNQENFKQIIKVFKDFKRKTCAVKKKVYVCFLYI